MSEASQAPPCVGGPQLGTQSGTCLSPVWVGLLRSVATVASLVIIWTATVVLAVRSFPPLSDAELAVLTRFPPTTLPDDLVLQRDILQAYAHHNPVSVVCGLSLVYCTMQTFAIPGTLTLSVLAGALFGVVNGLVLVSAVSTLGASCCYGMAWLSGKQLAQRLWPQRLGAFKAEVGRRSGLTLLGYMVLLRLTPILPNTFINVASPLVGLPLQPFVIGTLLGCLPNNFVAVSAGSRLGEIRSMSDMYDVKSLAIGLLVSGVALLSMLMHANMKSMSGSSCKRPHNVSSNGSPPKKAM